MAPDAQASNDAQALQRDVELLDVPLTPCRFADIGCPFPAVVIVEMDGGCVCFPDDREQALCAQHWNRSTPLGSFEEVEWAVAGSRLVD